METYVLKHPGHCTGMFWRGNPNEHKSGPSKPDWPRNGAVLKGVVHEIPSQPENSLLWLEVSEYKQSGSDSWEKTPGCWVQFDQGGRLLHKM